MNGFIHQNGTNLYDGQGSSILLRGVGFGNWLLPEGYMWRFFTKCDRPRQIEKLVSELLGARQAREFWNEYSQAYITHEDLRYIKSCGLNSVRVPFNARHLMFKSRGERQLNETTLRYIDRLLSWCAELGLYVVLDMHAAPGGQTGANIDDSEDDRPHLFEDETYQEDTVWLWRELACRYADNTYIAGYDLLNEPLPDWFSEHNEKVLPLYRKIVSAIREVDMNHLIILEGVHWATGWQIFESLREQRIDNCMLQFHKYWNNPDKESIKHYLDMRERLGYPIYMGEGGENNLAWYAGMFHLLEQHNISWNFWTYKKMDTHNSPISICSPDRWDALIDYISGGKKPEHADIILKDFLHNVYFENCKINDDVLRHVQRRAPLQIPAVYYDIEGNVYSKPYKGKALIPFREEDGSDLRFVSDENGELSFKHYGGEEPEECQRLCLAITQGDRFQYSFDADGEAISVHCRSKDGGGIRVCVNGREIRCFTVSFSGMHTYAAGVADKGHNILSIESLSCEVEVEWIHIGYSPIQQFN